MKREPIQLGPYFDAYIERRHDLKYQTRQTLRHTRAVAVDFFSVTRDMRTISVGEAQDFRRHVARDHAPATVAMYVKKLRQVWADAISRDLLGKNPWKEVKAGTQVNNSRQVYVPVADVLKVIDACTNPEWRMLFALARFAGMRIPSEPKLLRWGDINFGSDKEAQILIRSPKTQHHPGKEERFYPLLRNDFPDLERILLEGLSKAQDGSIYVLPRLRLHKNFHRSAVDMIRRAGLVPWKKLWNNLRSSCETDLAMRFPIHVVCAWLGNSASIAQRHYLQVTQDQVELANSGKRRKMERKSIDKASETYPIKRSLQESLLGAGSLATLQAIASAEQSLLRKYKRRMGRIDRRALAYLESQIDAAKYRERGKRGA